MPELIIMRLGVYIMPPEAISTAYLRKPFSCSTNTTASQIVEVMPLILLEFLN
jgi:hypothetical protein